MKFRDLRPDDIDVRVQSIKPNGLVALLYKDARVDQNILDETVGAESWQREHYEVKGNLFCRVGIKCGEEWVWKSDCGTESNTEKEKGEASDSFKRACFNWGIGRELYTSPFIFIPESNCNIKDTGNGRLACNDKFSVLSITIENKVITGLTIYNETRKCTAFKWGKSAKATETANSAPRSESKPTPPTTTPPKKENAPETPKTPPELDYVITDGEFKGWTMKRVYKETKIPDLIADANARKDTKVIEYIRIINAYINEYRLRQEENTLRK